MSWVSENEKQDFLESLWWTWTGAESPGEGGPGIREEGHQPALVPNQAEEGHSPGRKFRESRKPFFRKWY